MSRYKKSQLQKVFSVPIKMKNLIKPEQVYAQQLREMLKTKKQRSKNERGKTLSNLHNHQSYQKQSQFGPPQRFRDQSSRIPEFSSQYSNSDDSNQSISSIEKRDNLDQIRVCVSPYPKQKKCKDRFLTTPNVESIPQEKFNGQKIRLPKIYKNRKATEGFYSGKYRKNNLKTNDRQLISNYMNAVLIQVDSGDQKTKRKKKKSHKISYLINPYPLQSKNRVMSRNYAKGHLHKHSTCDHQSFEKSKKKYIKKTEQNNLQTESSALPRSLKKQQNLSENFHHKKSLPDYKILSHAYHLEKDHINPEKRQKKMHNSQAKFIDQKKQKKEIFTKKHQLMGKYSLNLHVPQPMQGKSTSIKPEENPSWSVIDPLFLETYFVKLKNKKIKESEHVTELSKRKALDLPGPPEKIDLINFIKNYIPENKNIIIQELVKSENFRIVYGESIDNSSKNSVPCLYFGETLSSDSNIKQGKGILIYENYLYQGQWKDDQKINGIEKNKMGVYKGTFKRNKREGQGQFFWSHGQYYSGQWKDGKKSGSGYWKSSADQSYMGQWANGQVNGYGVHTMKKDRKYQGQFINFLKHGFGREQFPNGDAYQGKYILGNAHGEGKYIWREGFKYEGSFFQGYREGTGVISSQDHLHFSGIFKKQKANGHGIMKYNNGDVFEGNYQESKRNGSGIFKIKKTKQIVKGVWIENNLDS